jgi:hypothetical protein
MEQYLNEAKRFILDNPEQVIGIIVAVLFLLILLYFLPRLLIAFYNDLVQLIFILAKWTALGIVLFLIAWMVTKSPVPCRLINEHLNLNLICDNVNTPNAAIH